MSQQVKVYTVLCVNSSILMVFYTPGHCWEFRIISRTDGIFREKKIYYTAEAALRTGFEWLRDER